MPKVTALYIYPVKSLRPIEVTSAAVHALGFFWDRNWLVVRPDGRFLTQRQIPRMALVETELPPEALDPQWGRLSVDAALTLSAPGKEPLQVPLVPAVKVADSELKECTCWAWTGLARDEGDDAATWLTDVLGIPCRLVRYVGEPAVGGLNADPKRREAELPFGKGLDTAFADCFPFLLATESSLADLNTRSTQQLPMNRFRPNIVVDDSMAPWAEDNWQTVAIAGAPNREVEFVSKKPCSRCKITTTDQETAEVGKEPLMTLGTFRSGKLLGWDFMAAWKASWKNEVFFGWLLAATNQGIVAVGDELIVRETRTAVLAA